MNGLQKYLRRVEQAMTRAPKHTPRFRLRRRRRLKDTLNRRQRAARVERMVRRLVTRRAAAESTVAPMPVTVSEPTHGD